MIMSQSLSLPLEATCPACGHHVAVSFYDGGAQPLATLAWPTTREQAKSLTRLHLDYVRCVSCGHVYNPQFDYRNVPYTEKPNLMFNRGSSWSEFLDELRTTMIGQLPQNPVVVEIGYGDGSFLSALAQVRPDGRYVGFDPHGATPSNTTIEFRADLFQPTEHLAELKPDLIISRHVLEHLVNPLGFLQQMSFCSSSIGISPTVFLEVPCIDAAISGRRTVDFFYEHSSQFTTESFSRMLSLATRDILEIGHGYEGEVVFGFAKLGMPGNALAHANEAQAFRRDTQVGLASIGKTLDALHASGKKVAIWGGTGKSAAFMCRYGVDALRFPLVVDSDKDKVGTFVPGTGQEIQFRDCLLNEKIDVVIIPPQWRAADIIFEMAQTGIVVDQVLIEHYGQMVDFHIDEHPYQK